MKKKTIIALSLLFLVGCGKNDPITTAGRYPYGPSVPAPSPTYPGFPGGYGGGGGYPGTGYPGGGYFQPNYPASYGPGFYPWAPIYGFYQQNVVLQPVFVVLWSGWQNYCNQYRVPIYDFTTFWYNYSPQVMSPQLYGYFANQFYPWMNPYATFSPYSAPEVFWQNYSGIPYGYSCASGCY
ncbi:MAG: hypothetical protein EB078_08440 [Proteobacteria bacterium]|nr:hypothetical protein [Pseudomonadota bacterium]NDC25830.1 hypothetical protein [Pseudomonadota bacterium]NDD04920.1 hypothetical protein [Pseudomonadota bacterium]NDG25628.1 hypothetical protein [Pseudomonadota bacterium]